MESGESRGLVFGQRFRVQKSGKRVVERLVRAQPTWKVASGRSRGLGLKTGKEDGVRLRGRSACTFDAYIICIIIQYNIYIYT